MLELNAPKNLPLKEQIYVHVVRHLMRQGEKAQEEGILDINGNPTVKCKYRTSRGLACAGGSLMADEFYNRSVEGRSVFAGGRPFEVIRMSIGIPMDEKAQYESADFIRSLQSVHDNHEAERWAEELKIVAQRENVSEYAVLCAFLGTDSSGDVPRET